MSNMNENTPILNELIKRSEASEKAVNNLYKQNTRILAILENDAATDTKGLVKQVKDNTEELKKINNFHTELRTRLGITNAIITIAMSGFVTFLFNLFVNKQ